MAVPAPPAPVGPALAAAAAGRRDAAHAAGGPGTAAARGGKGLRETARGVGGIFPGMFLQSSEGPFTIFPQTRLPLVCTDGPRDITDSRLSGRRFRVQSLGPFLAHIFQYLTGCHCDNG